MKPLLRTLGVAVLAAALLNASAGLCFCHRGPVLPGAGEASGGCCHGPDASGRTVVKTASSCCQIESADSSATPAAAIEFAPPDTVSLAVTDARPAAAVLPAAGAALSSSPPPIFALRI